MLSLEFFGTKFDIAAEKTTHLGGQATSMDKTYSKCSYRCTAEANVALITFATELVAAVRGVSYFVGVASAVRRHVHVYASLVCSPNGSS
jgi:hypothetical protein